MYTYTGNSTAIDDGNGNWRIKFLTDGEFRLKVDMAIDIFLVGGGGGGASRQSTQSEYGPGGGGGYTNAYMKQITKNDPYQIDIGSGGNGVTGDGYSGAQGLTTSAFGFSVSGGLGGTATSTSGSTKGGNGGSGGAGLAGTPGSDGSNGTGTRPGTGQGITTKEFLSSTGTLYSTGGQFGLATTVNGDNNTGYGGSGSRGTNMSGAGGSGIVVIRNMRINTVGNTVKYSFSYTGSYIIENAETDDWKIKFLSSGNYFSINDAITDVFLVGGGGGGTAVASTCGAGGGGYTNTTVRKSLTTNTVYPIVVGNGATSGQGGTSSAFGLTALGGYTGTSTNGGNGGSGGAGTASSSFDGGSDGSYGNGNAGTGQRTTTREFAEATGTLYAGGGGAARCGTVEGFGGAGGGGTGGKVGVINSQPGTPNTGGGGGSQVTGTTGGGKAGGSGIVIIRNTKINEAGDTSKFRFAYSGTYEIVNGSTDNWRIKFLTTGEFIPLSSMNIDAFLVGGGGAGTGAYSTCGAGGGGYTGITTANLTEGTKYTITIGLGALSGQGGTTTGFSTSVLGGYSGGASTGGNGGSGGAGTASGVFTGGSNGSNGGGNGGIGQGTTTREFGEVTGTLYSGGGGATRASGEGYGGAGGGGTGGLNLSTTPQPGTPNTGGGGGAQITANSTGGGKPGGSGVIVIRKH